MKGKYIKLLNGLSMDKCVKGYLEARPNSEVALKNVLICGKILAKACLASDNPIETKQAISHMLAISFWAGIHTALTYPQKIALVEP